MAPNNVRATNVEEIAELITSILTCVYADASMSKHFDAEAARRGITKEALAAAAIVQGVLDITGQ
jgi:hypothetical protein